MIKIDENGDLKEQMAVMESLDRPQAEALYNMYRHIFEDVKASEFPEGKEMEFMCGERIKVLESTPWLKEAIDNEG